MSRSDTKARILYILKILIQETDEDHYITVQQIIDRLAEHGISAYRKTVISDIQQLSEFGFNIVCVKSSQNRYHINNGIFTLSELKLLVDAVEVSQFITQSKSAELIGKLSDLTSSYNADNLCRHIYLSRRMKSDNEEIYDVVDKIHTAIHADKQITFLYYEYDNRKNKVLRNNGERYSLSPYAMTWEDSRYYVIGFSLKRDKVITFRADRMSEIKVTENICVPPPVDFKVADFVGKVFRMYDDKTVTVTLKCKNRVMKSVIDRFGMDVDTEPYADGQHFKVIVEVSAGQTFFGWVFQFGGDIQIVKPDKIKNEFAEMGKKIFD